VNTPEVAGGVATPDGDAVVLLSLVAPGDDPVAGAQTDGLKETQLRQLQRTQIAGLPAAQLRADTRDGDRVLLTWVAHRKHVMRVTGLTAVRRWERYEPAIERATRSFRALRPADRERIVESRLRVREARAGETIDQVLARGGSTWNAARIAMANGTTVNARLDPGWPVKVPVAQRYVRAAGS
jgi:predicted Zn-dependent protease